MMSGARWPRTAVVHRGQVVPHDLQGVIEVVQVLDLSNGAKPAHGQSNALPDNGAFSDAGIGDPVLTKGILHAFHRLG